MLMVISKRRTVASLDDVNEARRHLTGRDQGEGRGRPIAPLHLERSQLRDGLMADDRVEREPRQRATVSASGLCGELAKREQRHLLQFAHDSRGLHCRRCG